MSSKKSALTKEKKLQKKFEVSTAHLSKCFDMASRIFADIYKGNVQQDDNLAIVEKLERSARFFASQRKTEPFYKVPSFFYFIRERLREVKSLDADFKSFEQDCRREWSSLSAREKKNFAKGAERLRRLVRKINGFGLFDDNGSGVHEK